jgi:hypothetical protein
MVYAEHNRSQLPKVSERNLGEPSGASRSSYIPIRCATSIMCEGPGRSARPPRFEEASSDPIKIAAIPLPTLTSLHFKHFD